MSALRRLWQRLRALVSKDALDAEFDEEARIHLELAVDDYLQQGLSRAAAERLARAKFGLAASAKDAHRDARGLAAVDALLFDLRQAVRSLRRDRAFSITMVVTLTVALALNATVFVVMDATLFRGFPLVEHNERLVFLQERGPSGPRPVPYADVEEWRRQAQAFTGFAFVAGRPITFRDHDGRPNDMRVWQVDANTFDLLGVEPLLGRDFVPADQDPGAPLVVMLNHRFWRSRFQARPDIVGVGVTVNERPATVIGVMPERFDFPLKIDGDMWMPLPITPALTRRGSNENGLAVVGRLRAGLGLDEGRAQLETINRRIEAEHPDTNRGVVPLLMSHAYMNSGPHAGLIWGSLWGASWFVLLIACANLANLTLVRTIGRWRELATKLALGAGAARVIRQLAIECLLAAGVAGLLAWRLMVWSVSTWDAVTASQYQVLDYSIDLASLGYVAAITFVSALLIVIAPVVRIRQIGTSAALKGDARGVSRSAQAKHLAGGLVAVQMALAIVLLAGAGLLVRSFTQIVGADTGVGQPERVVIGQMRLPSVNYANADTRRQYFDRLVTALEAVPGVERVSLANTTPVRFAPQRGIEIEGRPSDRDDGPVSYVRTSAGYFGVLGTAPLAGREFTSDDRAESLATAIVNQSFVDRFLPGQDAIGRRIRDVNGGKGGVWRVVIGVVPNILQSDPLRQTFKPLVYVPMAQEAPALNIYWLARSSGATVLVADAARRAAESIDADVPVTNFATLEQSFAFDRDFMDLEHSELGKYAKVAPVFAGIALLLSAIGLTAVIAHSVGQRTKEIGVRMAIGATGPSIRRLILREGLSPVAIGVLAGLALSLAMNRLLESQLVGVSPYDLQVMIGAPLILTFIAAAASVMPARRAVAVDPVVALRND
jgi:putative ABC transport system permease protein